MQKRLILCLDGTWNQGDSSTNVLHHFNLVYEGEVRANPITEKDYRPIYQRKYYHPGVGTGVLDGITGGGFGFGLEKNVRDAYNWLIEQYCDGDANTRADEIFIFGFSRGSYTARSLVGFIGRCGLLRRGAPLTVAQLWDQYCILGRDSEERSSPWDHVFGGKRPADIRQITTLVHDAWLKPGQGGAVSPPQNQTEELLVQWSRRVKITYLGVYDTVGAIGWDALAIPGLTSRIALHNNMRPTTLIQKCRHALAIDEERSSFNHTPFLAFVGNAGGAAELARAGGTDAVDASADSQASAKLYWDRTIAMWRRKIEQRWFVGAHSNIGGGYPDNRLADTPLQWLLEGAAKSGMVSESVTFGPPPTPAQQTPRDSFVEFAAPLWAKILRAKRNYRAMDPDPLPQASANAEEALVPPPGFSLQTIHEDVDDSVAKYWSATDLPIPPNLFEYVRRKSPPNLAAIKDKKALHPWLGTKLWDYVVLILWATIASTGLATLFKLTGSYPRETSRLFLACVVAFMLPIVDWSESGVNFRRAMGEGNEASRAFLDAIYWSRAFGFLFFACGAVHSTIFLWTLGWDPMVWPKVGAFLAVYWPVPVFAAAAVLIANLIERFGEPSAGPRVKISFAALVAGPLCAIAGGLLVIVISGFLRIIFPSLIGSIAEITPVESVAGLLLVLQFALVYFVRSASWCGEPLSKANLGSIRELQRCATPGKVIACLERWRLLLASRWAPDDSVTGPAAIRLRSILRETLWRDILGFIPVYSGAFLFGLWFGARHAGFEFLNKQVGPLPLWVAIPLLATATDYLEDICHLRYIHLHEQGKPPSILLTLFSWSMSGIKGLAVIAELLITVAAMDVGTYRVWMNEGDDWRAKFALLLSVLALAGLLIFIVGRIYYLLFARKKVASSSGR